MPPRLARLLAVLAALALVAGAFAARSALRDDEPTVASSGSGSDSGGSAPSGGGPLRILCDEDLGPACAALVEQVDDDVVDVVRADEAIDRLGGKGDLTYDAWLTLDPIPETLTYAVDPNRPVELTEPEALASSPLAVLADPAVTDCTGATDWACLAAPANPPVGIPDPTTALGSLVLAHAAAGLVGQVDLSTNDIDDETRTGLADLLAGLGRDRRTGAEASQAIIQSGYLSAVVAPEGLARAVATTPRGRDRALEVAALAPAATIGVVLVGVGPRGPAALDALRPDVAEQTVIEALAQAGWTGPADRTSGLPRPDVIFALQERFA